MRTLALKFQFSLANGLITAFAFVSVISFQVPTYANSCIAVTNQQAEDVFTAFRSQHPLFYALLMRVLSEPENSSELRQELWKMVSDFPDLSQSFIQFMSDGHYRTITAKKNDPDEGHFEKKKFANLKRFFDMALTAYIYRVRQDPLLSKNETLALSDYIDFYNWSAASVGTDLTKADLENPVELLKRAAEYTSNKSEVTFSFFGSYFQGRASAEFGSDIDWTGSKAFASILASQLPMSTGLFSHAMIYTSPIRFVVENGNIFLVISEIDENFDYGDVLTYRLVGDQFVLEQTSRPELIITK